MFNLDIIDTQRLQILATVVDNIFLALRAGSPAVMDPTPLSSDSIREPEIDLTHHLVRLVVS